MPSPDASRRPHRLARKSKLCAVVSDIHFDLEDVYAWRAFRQWHKAWTPNTTVILGDFVDLGMMSKYVQAAGDAVAAIPQIRRFVTEANALAAECGRLVVVEGNHDERWSKYLFGALPHVLRDAVGLTLRDQCRTQGLTDAVEWRRESAHTDDLVLGGYVLRHGHRQASRFGGGKHLAANALAKSLGTSSVTGHHHRAQLFCQTSHGRTAVAVANPCMTRDHEYSPGADWQRGFTVLEIDEERDRATPHVVLIDDGRFSYGGWTYDGRGGGR